MIGTTIAERSPRRRRSARCSSSWAPSLISSSGISPSRSGDRDRIDPVDAGVDAGVGRVRVCTSFASSTCDGSLCATASWTGVPHRSTRWIEHQSASVGTARCARRSRMASTSSDSASSVDRFGQERRPLLARPELLLEPLLACDVAVVDGAPERASLRACGRAPSSGRRPGRRRAPSGRAVRAPDRPGWRRGSRRRSMGRRTAFAIATFTSNASPSSSTLSGTPHISTRRRFHQRTRCSVETSRIPSSAASPCDSRAAFWNDELLLESLRRERLADLRCRSSRAC